MFYLSIEDIQPSQFYLSIDKVEAVFTWFCSDILEPLPIMKSGDRIFLTDGHSRAFVAFENGLTELPVYWDDDNWPFYENCVSACEERGIFTIKDLADRQLSAEVFEEKWLGFCRELTQRNSARD